MRDGGRERRRKRKCTDRMFVIGKGGRGERFEFEFEFWGWEDWSSVYTQHPLLRFIRPEIFAKPVYVEYKQRAFCTELQHCTIPYIPLLVRKNAPQRLAYIYAAEYEVFVKSVTI